MAIKKSTLNKRARFELEGSFQEIIRMDASFFKYCSKRSFRYIARMVRDGSIPITRSIIPNLMASCGLSVKDKAEFFQLLNDLSILKTRQPSHY